MRVGFFHVTPEGQSVPAMPARMVASVRQAMPDVEIVQFLPVGDSAHVQRSRVSGVDTVKPALPGPMTVSILDAYASVAGEWLFLDTDIVVREDVRSVFDAKFDVAVADRAGTLLDKEVGTKLMRTHRHNKGVVFSRSPGFWLSALERLRESSAAVQADLRSDQLAMNATILAGAFDVLVLDSRYNYPPKSAQDDVRDKAILHLKGKRKVWADRFYGEVLHAAA